MTVKYHGLPITPNAILHQLAGHSFCVSHARPDQIELADKLGQSVMLDNGAFSKFTKNKPTDWPAFYAWCERWLQRPTTWAVIPDVIDAGTQEQDALLREWPFGHRGAPVWHSDEPIERLLRLVDEWPRVCIGSTGEHFQILSSAWQRRMDETWNALMRGRQFTPTIHMLRGMQLATHRWPFASLDSTDVGRNHNRPGNDARTMARRWDAHQCPSGWTERALQMELVA